MFSLYPESQSGDYGILTSYVAVGISYVGIFKARPVDGFYNSNGIGGGDSGGGL